LNSVGTEEREAAVGSEVEVVKVNPNATLRFYVADRPSTSSSGKLGAEIVLEVLISVAHPLQKVWPIFKDVNAWMGRFGFEWDSVPADNEGRSVFLGNKPGVNDLKYEDRTEYIVRKVIPGRLIYTDSLPSPIPNKDGCWTGHNVKALYEENGKTEIAIFMEHTWYSDTMTIEELRAEARGVLDAGVAFWRDYFIVDLLAAIEASAGGAA
jgi:hypothetical protein